MAVEIIKDEVDKARERYKDMGGDITRLRNPDKSKRYKFVNKDPQRVAHYKAAGYEIVGKDSKTKAMVEQGTDKGGQELGDLVLMETSMENYHRRLQKAAEKGAKRERLGREQAMERINKMARDEARVSPHKDIAFDESSDT